jgi:nicotinate-nucleotide adenylyltransferase
VKIAIFGGTFDPVHSGHVRAARAAARKFHLDKILFVPASRPPHKRADELTDFEHRYAMVALACAADSRLVPSLLEAPRRDGRPQYSVETVGRLKRRLRPRDQLFFIVGADAFLDVPHWRQFRRLLKLVEFIVVSRPGFEKRKIIRALPPDLVHRAPRAGSDRILTGSAGIHILSGVNAAVSSSEIRTAVQSGRKVTGGVPRLVEQYISKEALYRSPKADGR